MNKEDKKIPGFLEVVVVILIMSIYTIFSLFYMPIMLILFPIPFIVLGVKNNAVEGLTSLMTTFTLVAYIVDPGTALYFFIVFAPITVSIIYSIKKRKNAMVVLATSSVTFFASILLIIALMNSGGTNIITILEDAIRQTLNMQVEILKETGFTSYEILQRKNLFENIYNYTLLIFPAILLGSSLVIAYINYSLSIIGLKKAGIDIVHIPKFSRFRMPENISLGIIVMSIGVYIMKIMNSAYYETIFINIFVLIMFMFIIQGLSVMNYLLVRLRINSILRFIFTMLTIVIAPMVTMASLLGLVDMIFDIRKIRGKKSL